MIIPVRCFSCGKMLADKYHLYHELIACEYDAADALDTIGLNRYCCRRIMLTHVDFNDQLLKYNPADNAMGLNNTQTIAAAQPQAMAVPATGNTPQSSPHMQ